MIMQRSLVLFESAIKSKATWDSYFGQLKRFLEWTKIKNPDGLLQLKDDYLQKIIEDYLLFKRKNVSPNSITPIFAAL